MSLGRWIGRSRWLPLAGLGAAVAVVSTTGVAKQAEVEDQPVGADAIEPEGGVGGYAVERLESEISIHIPDAEVENVWRYLADTYGKPDGAWPEGVDRRALSARLSDERFVDRYFDTPNLTVLAGQNGVRWRIREIPGAPEDPKDDRQLVQIKVTSGGDTVTRGEYKFPVKKSVVEHGASSVVPMDLIRDRFHKPFKKLTRAIGVDPARLREVLRLDQHRRRVYFSDSKGPMMTITLDQVTARKWWAKAPWNEMEVEIGEVRYTEASASERAYWEGVRGAIRGDLFRRFHNLYEDDLPKYGEGFTRLEKKLPFMRRMIAARDSVVPVSVIGLGVVALVGVGLSIGRRRRGGPGSGAGNRRLTPRMAGTMLVLVALGVAAVGCGGGGGGAQTQTQTQPPPTTNGSEPDLGAAPATPLTDAESYFPLGAGSTWTFNIVHSGVPGTKNQNVDGTEALTGDKSGVTAVRMKEDIAGDVQMTWFERRGSATVTHRQNELDPGGNLKFDETYTPFDVRIEEAPDRLQQGATYSIQFQIARTDPQKGNSNKPKTHDFIVEAAGESVTVTAGTFTTVRVRRTDPSDGSFRQYWYAKGLGKVKEQDSNGDTEELAAFTGVAPTN